MSANARAARRGTIHKAPESADEIMVKMRFDHGLCMTCNAKLFEVTGTGGRRKLNPVTTPGVSIHGRCLYCHPEHDNHSVKEEEENWEDADTIPVEEVETGEDIDDQSWPPVITLDRKNKRFVGVVLEGNVNKGKGLFSHVVETGEHKDKLIVYKGEFDDGFFEGRGSLRHEGKGYVLEGQWKKSKKYGHFKEILRDGDMYEGERKNDIRDGLGTYTWANGKRYKGEWKNGKRDGQGTFHHADGRVTSGTWEEDKYLGK